MIGTSLQLSNKMPDRVLQLWTTGLSNYLNQANGVADPQLTPAVQFEALLQHLQEGAYYMYIRTVHTYVCMYVIRTLVYVQCIRVYVCDTYVHTYMYSFNFSCFFICGLEAICESLHLALVQWQNMAVCEYKM